MRKTIIFIICCIFYVQLSCQKSTFENINDVATNILTIFGKKKDVKPDSSTITTGNKSIISKKLSSSQNAENICRELCIRSYNKRNARVELKNKMTLETTSIAVMSKDKSCIFDIHTGIYILQILIDDKLTKSSEIRIENELELLEIPDI